MPGGLGGISRLPGLAPGRFCWRLGHQPGCVLSPATLRARDPSSWGTSHLSAAEGDTAPRVGEPTTLTELGCLVP